MKHFRFIIVLLIVCGCVPFKSSPPVLHNYYKLSDLDEIELKQYMVKPVLYPILDSVIDFMIVCEDYKNLQMGFTLDLSKDSINNIEIDIGSMDDLYTLNYNYCDGVFFYKGYQFLYYGPYEPELLEDMHRYKRLFFMNPEKLRNYYPSHDEFFNSIWTFSFINGDFKFIDSFYCNKYYKAND